MLQYVHAKSSTQLVGAVISETWRGKLYVLSLGIFKRLLSCWQTEHSGLFKYESLTVIEGKISRVFAGRANQALAQSQDYESLDDEILYVFGKRIVLAASTMLFVLNKCIFKLYSFFMLFPDLKRPQQRLFSWNLLTDRSEQFRTFSIILVFIFSIPLCLCNTYIQ